MPDNVLGVLFQDIANAIRAKTGGTDTMKPAEFPDEIAAILVGSGSDEWLYASGSFDADSSAHIISHGLGVAPDIAILRCPVSLNAEVSSGYSFLWSFGISEEFGNDVKVVKGSSIKSINSILEWSTTDGTIKNYSTSYINKGTDALSAISNAHSSSITFGKSDIRLGTKDGTCYWYVFARKKASGGSSADVRYVTFVGADGSVLYKKAVAVGDDCVDVEAKKLIETPTKEMDVANTYTYSGWSLTDGGAASSDALKAVTEDRTVYAAFTASARYYTITYYDSDGTTILNTISLAYGSNANYIPEKSGFSFVGWTPDIVTVEGDASYTAIWQEKITFAAGSWSDINEVCENGEAANYFKVGDTRTEQSGDNTYVYRIIGINFDDKANGSGKAGITVAVSYAGKKLDKMQWDETGSYKWESKVYTSSGSMTKQCTIRTWLQTTFLATLPEQLQNIIKPVTKTTIISSSTINTIDTVFLPSVYEVLLKQYFSTDTAEPLGQYPYFATTTNRIFYDTNDSQTRWWTRNKSESTICIASNGYNGESVTPTQTHGVLPCFCI